MKRVTGLLLILVVVLATGAVAMAENGPKVGNSVMGMGRLGR